MADGGTHRLHGFLSCPLRPLVVTVTANRWVLVAYGRPAPQGSKRHVGGGHMVESSTHLRPWRTDVKEAALALKAAGALCLDGPLVVRMTFTLARPKSARKTDLVPCKYPDLSKLCRATEDAITDAGLWADDARVARCHLAKVWADYDDEALPMPGVLVVAEEWPASDEWGSEAVSLSVAEDHRLAYWPGVPV